MANDKWTKRNGYLSLAGIKFWRADWDTAIRYVAGDGVHSTSTGSAYICILEHTADAAKEPGVGVDWQLYWNVLVEGGNGNVFIDVTQTGHGLVIGDYVRQDTANPNSYVPAVASSFLNSQGIGFVVDVPDADHFVLVQTGYVINALGAVPSFPEGTALYLSPTTPGGVTSTKPSTVGQYIKPVAIITEDGVSMWVLSDFPTAVPTGGGGGVQSVTDDGKGIVNVNNTDVQNPVVEFDEVALANYVPFIDALVGNSYFTTELANDANFITELTNNANFQTNVNNFVSNGSGGLFSVGISNKLGINITDADPSLAYIKPMKFGNDLVVLTRGTNNSGNFKVRVYSRNSDGGYTEAVIADIPTSNGIGTGVMSVSISKELDNSKLYVSKVSRSAGGGVQPVPMDIAIDEYDSSYSLVTTYTGQTLNSLFNSDVSSGFFVNGSSVYISLDNFRPGTVPKHWNRWTISGVSLTSVTDTNLVKGDDSPAFSDGTNAWFSEGGSVSHFTYSGISFTFIGTSNFPTSTIGVNLTKSTSTDSYQGVEIVSSGTKIGWFINTSRTMQEYSSTAKHMDYMYEYNIYDF